MKQQHRVSNNAKRDYLYDRSTSERSCTKKKNYEACVWYEWVNTQTQTARYSCMCCVRGIIRARRAHKKFLHKPWETQIEAILKTSWIKEKSEWEKRKKTTQARPMKYNLLNVFLVVIACAELLRINFSKKLISARG